MNKFLDKIKIEEIYAKCIEILEYVGINFDTPESQELFRKAGAIVEGNNIKIPANMVDKYLSLMPDAAPVSTEKRVAATSPFGNVPMLYEEDEDTYRRVTIDDAIKMYKLTQTSDLYECCNIATVDPIGIDTPESYVAQIAMALKYSDKWFSNGARATAQNSYQGDMYKSAKKALRMIRDFYGTYDEPVMSQYICPMSPLAYDSECLHNLNAAVEEKQLIGLSPCSLPNITSPASIISTAIHDFALSLAGIIYVQLLSPGAPVSLSNATGMTDMVSIQPAYATSEAVLIQCIFYELAKYKNIDAGFCGTLADAAKVDFQAGVESLLTTTLPFYYVDIDCIWCYPGHMAAWYCGSFEKTILDEEIMRYVNRSLSPVNTEIETDLIKMMKEAKEKNTFLTGRTPKEYRRDVYLTKIFSKYGVGDDIEPLKKEVMLKVKKAINDRTNQYIQPERTPEQQKLLNEYLPTRCKY